MCRLVCAFVVLRHRRRVFLRQDPNESITAPNKFIKVIYQAILYLPVTGHWPAVFAHGLWANTRVNNSKIDENRCKQKI